SCDLGGFVFPVANDGERTDDQRRSRRLAIDSLFDESCEYLDGFAESHVVSETATEAELFEIAQPAEATFLIGPQLAVESLRGLDVVDPRFEVGVEQVREGTLELAVNDRESVVGVSHSGIGLQRLRDGHLTVLGLVVQLKSVFDVSFLQRDPLTAHANEWHFECSQLFEVVFRQPFITENHIPAKLTELLN